MEKLIKVFYREKFGITPTEIEINYLTSVLEDGEFKTLHEYFQEFLDSIVEVNNALYYIEYGDRFRIDLDLLANGRYYVVYEWDYDKETWVKGEGYRMLIDTFYKNGMNNRSNEKNYVRINLL